MKNRKHRSAALLLGLLLFSSSLASAVEDAILAVVNNEVITLKDLKDYINTTYMSLAAQGLSESEIEKAMKDLEENGLNKLIEDKLILSRANEIGMTIREKLIEDEIDKVIARYPSQEMFMNALLLHGGTLSDLRKKIEDQLKIKYVIENEIRSKIYISPQEITKFYNKNMNQFQKKEKINLESIFISFGANKIDARQKAEKALDLIKQGGDFKSIAKEYSDAPSIGTVERGQLTPEIEKIVFHLSDVSPSEIVELETGYYIFKLTGRSSASVASLQDVRDQIHDRLYRSRFRELYLDWINKLKENAFIDIKQ
jgi:parvulin-like peptidyl-prolyl isomerase